MAELELRQNEVKVEGAVNANRRWTARKSHRIELSLGTRHGLGEAAPLVGFSSESDDDVERALLNLRRTRALAPLTESHLKQATPSDLPCWGSEPPSVQFALQSAWLDLLGQVQGVPVWRLLRAWLGTSDPAEPAQLPSAATLVGMAEMASTTTVQPGVRTLKAKLGPMSRLETQLQNLSLLRSGWAGRLRLDANGSLGADWERVLAVCEPLSPEFVEEPCLPEHLGEARALPCPIAFDESLKMESPASLEPWLASGSVQALVLKPMLLGSLHGIRDWAVAGGRHGVQCVISHLFDGGLAMTCYRHIAAAWGSQDSCSGLGSHAGLALWPLPPWSPEAPGLGFGDP